jgi:hypothetical protein
MGYKQAREALEQVELVFDNVNRELQFATKSSLPTMIAQLEGLSKRLGVPFPFKFDLQDLDTTKQQIRDIVTGGETPFIWLKEHLALLQDKLEQQVSFTRIWKDELTRMPQAFAMVGEAAGKMLVEVAKGTTTSGELLGHFFLGILQMVLDTVQKAVLAFAVQGAAAAFAGNAGAPGIGLIVGAAAAGATLAAIRGMLSQIPQPGQVKKMARGGLVTGGVAGRDSVPALLQPGEFVVPKKDVDAAKRGGGGGVNVQISTTVPPSRGEMKRYLRQNLVPALRDLKAQGMTF